MSDMVNMTKEEQIEQMWKERTEDQLIAAYVPEADVLTRDEALKLALERDLAAAKALQEEAVQQGLKELGF